MKTFIESAESRKTSPELMEAIFYVSGHSEAKSVRIWESPTESEAVSIWEWVTKNGLLDSTGFNWGASGSKWATDTGAETQTGD